MEKKSRRSRDGNRPGNRVKIGWSPNRLRLRSAEFESDGVSRLSRIRHCQPGDMLENPPFS
uniref:Uncharacterized protein n=1 Tax=Oryza sativa subsp. japonica TaxID=39947 RepID=Q5TKD2_ORYSJ|nr:hypothetical protein [Oryza sativa Japonica Group]